MTVFRRLKKKLTYANALSIFSFLFTFILIGCAASRILTNNSNQDIDTREFYDSAHHWYDINDEAKIISPNSDQRKYSLNEIEKIADNILLFQKANGGWAKNYDMLAILSDEQKAAVLKAKDELNTTFDNGATHSQLNYLAEAYLLTKKNDYKKAFIHGLNFVLSAQYENGGWPQFYPDTSGYKKYITFNDGAMIGIMKLLQKIVSRSVEFSFLGSEILNRINNSFEKGIECILNCQINENGKLLVWCQQHDNIDFHPQNARSFELASICNGESSAIVKLLMSIKNPSERIKKSIINAVKWFEDSRIYGIRVDEIKADKADFIYHSSTSDRVVIEDANAKPIWTRFYELGTHRPMFCNRDGKVVYSLTEVDRERRTGYAWYIYDPQEVLDLYLDWEQKWMKD
ncbi:MAG: pectate lyase [Ignavibacteriaceae bacterium]|nr:pectate lyase [Ignavibacteriaceae bacterium]